MTNVDPVTPTPTQSPAGKPRAGDRLLERIQNDLSSHREHTAGELAKMKRELEDLLAENRREDTGFRQEIKDAIKGINDFMTEQREAAKARDDVGNKAGTIVVPPGDVKPVAPPEEVIEGTEEVEQPKRTWKDWF